MCPQSISEENPPTFVTPPIHPRMPWRVVEAEALADYKLRVRFVDGTEGTVDMAGLIHSSAAGVFAQLSDPSRFAQACVTHGAVTWPGEIDLAPDAMYAEIKQGGHWILG
jgi:hypothetical protein